MTLHRSAGPRHSILYDGRELDFDASDSGRWTNSVPAVWKEPAPILCTFTWFDDDGVLQQCNLTAGHPWDEGNQPVPHSAKGVTAEQARALLREGISSDAYAELAARFDPELGVDAPDEMLPPLTSKAPKAAKAAKKRAAKKVSGKAK